MMEDPEYNPLSDIKYWHPIKNRVCGEFHINQTEFKKSLLPLSDLKLYFESRKNFSSSFEDVLLPNIMYFINDPVINAALEGPSQIISFRIDKAPMCPCDKYYIGGKILSIQDHEYNSLMKTVLFENRDRLDLFGNCLILPQGSMRLVSSEPYRVNISYDKDMRVTNIWGG